MPQTARLKVRVQGSAFGDQELDCVVEGDYLVHDDTIICTERQARQKGLVIQSENRRWPKGIVPYVVHEDLLTHTGNVPTRISGAIAEIQNKTRVRFVERTDEHDFVEFVRVPDSRCRSHVGRQGGRQEIILGPRCDQPQVLHEILHALGLQHEHTRGDRDEFVEILTENIDPSKRGNFSVRTGDEPVGPYDYSSRMHYEERAFTRNGQPTMRSKTDQRIAPVLGMSPGDVAAVNAIYPEVPKPDEQKPDPQKPDPQKPDTQKPDEQKPDPAELLFQGKRFKVTVEWTTKDGKKGPGRAVPGATDSSGLFYFFDRNNWEILCKVLNGTGFNRHFWVYVAAATDTQWVLSVEDTKTRKVKKYSHPGGAPSPAVADTEAFKDA